MVDTLQIDDEAMLSELGVDVPTVRTDEQDSQRDRLRSGFAEILAFHDDHGRIPSQDVGPAIVERLLAVRLAAIRRDRDAAQVLRPLDRLGLLHNSAQSPIDRSDDDMSPTPADTGADALSDEEMLIELELNTNGPAQNNGIFELRHVRPATIRRAESVAERFPCPDFERFKERFHQVAWSLRNGTRKTLPFGEKKSGETGSDVSAGDLFILNGQLLLVAETLEHFTAPNGEQDAKLRVIYDNCSESNLLMRSLKRALNKDKLSRRVEKTEESDQRLRQLAQGHLDPGSVLPIMPAVADRPMPTAGTQTGVIYVLRSASPHPYITRHRNQIHKIGVTGGSVANRIANAEHDATYLLAKVELVDSYTLHNINRKRLEKLLHRIFSAVRLDITISDRFGQPVKPREWFQAPLEAIAAAVSYIQDGSILNRIYDPNAGTFKLVRQARSESRST